MLMISKPCKVLHAVPNEKKPIPSTTLLVSPRTEGLDLIGLEEPENEILEEPEQHLAMHGRQRASPPAGGKKPLWGAEAALIGKA